MKTARFWQPLDDGRVLCELCPHGCRPGAGRSGLCGVRTNVGGELMAASYGRLSSVAMDPIEKKPLYHFRPGCQILSIGGWGCNFACTFCQNWSISQQAEPVGRVHRPEEVVALAQAHGSSGIAYTYNEPLVGYEFVADCAGAARAAGLVNVLVTNGYIKPGPAAELLPLVDALNVDIKSMDDGFYRDRCRGSLAPVLAFARGAAEAGCHVEITNLLIPGLNDASQAVLALAEWVAGKLGKKTPLHLSAYRPQYKMRRPPPTPPAVLERAYETAAACLDYVYLGNAPGLPRGRDTLCPGCGGLLVERRGYAALASGIAGGACAGCGRPADVIGAAG